MTAAAFREKLPSALAAIALQVGLLALLALSFEVVRHIDNGKETILVLPPLARPATAAKAVVIDGRGKPAPGPALPGPQNLPAWATPGFAFGGGANGILLAPPAGALGCRPENILYLPPAARHGCIPPELALRNPDAVPLLPNFTGPNADIWQAEIDRRNAPVSLPGASGGWIGMLFTLLADPGAYGDRRSYSYAQPQTPAMDNSEMVYQFVMHQADCPTTVMDDTSRKACQANLAAAPMMALAGSGGGGGGGQHVSAAAFADAQAAALARRSLYARPVIASGAQPGGGNEKDGGSGGAGSGAVAGGTNPGR